ncbi:MAG: hypothetical protein SPD98_04810 [Tractidigestivibacter sp.]|uniref:hypothetical protein n=1 Tax=Tractidigestivibacter sp. TaxID=2847320 RepID=UPI002A7EE3ED|nr:hypothetical protein [Tractidigestivibacter sp.]MDY4534552.1 hypothetical protein [Tractidigestivibacter sp.]
MSELSALRAQERSCRSRIGELTHVLSSLADFRDQVRLSRIGFEDQLGDKVRLARRASGLSGKLAKRYAEMTEAYLTGEFGQHMADGFTEVDMRAASAVARADEELEDELSRLASIREQIMAAEARERAEQAARRSRRR